MPVLIFTGKPCRRGHTAGRYKNNHACVECMKLHNDARGLKPRVKGFDPKAYKKSYLAAHYDEIILKNREWRHQNPEKAAAQTKRWQKKNPVKLLAATRAREAAILERMPAWVNREEILPFYEKAAAETRHTGVKHHVDHIVPLRGKNVSGLHVPWNLQVIPALDNLRKFNHFEDAA